jgi:hypothetical protein
MEEIIVNDKQRYLNENNPLGEIFSLTDKRLCLHCKTIIVVGKYKVYRRASDGFEFICCPNAPECNGTAIDWMPVGLFDNDEEEEEPPFSLN